MKHVFVKTLAGGGVAALAALACSPASATDILARVISSTPVVQQVAVPRQVCNNQQVITQAPRSGAGALLGAVAGGAIGNAIGSGGGRAAATVLGAVGGAVVGDNVEGSRGQLQNVQQCTTQTFYENRPGYYNVVYEYQGTQYTTQMANDPGGYVRLQVSAVGALPAEGQALQPAPAAAPQAYYQGDVVQQPVYVQPAPAVYPVYYPRPYYAPYYAPIAPIGLSLNFGFGGHGRWR